MTTRKILISGPRVIVPIAGRDADPLSPSAPPLLSSPIVIDQAASVMVAALTFPPIVIDQGASVSIDAAASTDPIGITGADLLQWVRADLGIAESGGLVSQWSDQGSGAKHYTQGTGANQPAYTAADATLLNLPTLTFDGTNDSLQSALQLPAPGTTPT